MIFAIVGPSGAGKDTLIRGVLAARPDLRLVRRVITRIPQDQVTGPGDVIFNGSRASLPLAARTFPGLRVILVTAPDIVLAARLAARGRETAEDIRARLSRAAFRMPEGIAFQTVINDESPDVGIARLLAALQPVRA